MKKNELTKILTQSTEQPLIVQLSCLLTLRHNFPLENLDQSDLNQEYKSLKEKPAVNLRKRYFLFHFSIFKQELDSDRVGRERFLLNLKFFTDWEAKNIITSKWTLLLFSKIKKHMGIKIRKLKKIDS